MTKANREYYELWDARRVGSKVEMKYLNYLGRGRSPYRNCSSVSSCLMC